MAMDMVDLYDRGTAWTAEKIANLKPEQLDGTTPCDEWSVRDLVNHCLDGQETFAGAARGEQISGPPSGPPPQLIGDDPAGEYETARQQTLAAFREPGALEKAGQYIAIGVVDQLAHGWDIAKATGQDAEMPDDLAEAAFGFVNGMMDDADRRGSFFKPQVAVPDDARAQDKLLGYLGRNP